MFICLKTAMQEHELRMIQRRTTCSNIITLENKLIEAFTNDKHKTLIWPATSLSKQQPNNQETAATVLYIFSVDRLHVQKL